MINNNFTYAIVGASKDVKKYGHIVLRDLFVAGYHVVPINLNEEKILGLEVFHSLSEYSNKIDVVIFVVPPIVTEKVLGEVLSLGIKDVWMQPGSENAITIKFCKDNNINCIHNSCIMIERK